MAHAFQHIFYQLLLVLGQQRVDLVVRPVADRVDLWAEVLARNVWIVVEQRLNLVVVLVKQRSDLFPLVWREFQIFGKTI